MRRAGRRIRNGPAFKAMSAWRETAEERRHQRQLLRRGLMRMQHRKFAEALQQWQDVTNAGAHRTMLLRRGLMRMLQRKLAQAFARWVEWLEAINHQKYIVAGALTRMQKLKFSQAWEMWQFNTAELLRERELMRQCLVRMQLLKVSRALNGWLAAYDHACRVKELGERVLRRMKNAAMWQAYSTWQHWVQMSSLMMGDRDLHAQIVKLTEGLHQEQISHHHTSEAWSAAIEKAQRDHAQDAEELRKQLADLRSTMHGTIFQRAASRIKNLPVSLAFNAWWETACAMADEQRMLRRGLMRMLQRGLAQAYEGWRSYLQMVNENKATMMHFVNRMMQRQLSKAFESWQARTEELLQQAATADQVLRRMLHGKMYTAWSTWYDWFRFGRLRILEARCENEKERRQMDLEICALEMSHVVTATRDETLRAEESWKFERKALEELLLEARASISQLQSDFMQATQKQRLLMQESEREKNKEIDTLRARLAVFCPAAVQRRHQTLHAH